MGRPLKVNTQEPRPLTIEVVPARMIPERIDYQSVIDALLTIKLTEALKIQIEQHKVQNFRTGLTTSSARKGVPITTRYRDGFLYVQRRA
jgi:hypothetical protein